MKRNKKVFEIFNIFLMMILVSGSICWPATKAKAASAAINLSLSSESIEVDNTFSVVLSVEASEEIGTFSCFLSFDTDMLEFVSGGAYVTGGNGLVLISDENSESETASKKYSMKFKALKSGETTLWVDEDVQISCALDGAAMSVSNNQLLFEIVDPDQISGNTNLKSLTVSTSKLSPEFSKEVKKYTMKIPALIEQISVNPEPQDPEATVSVSGNQKLKTGKNTVKITVTAPNGDQSVTKIIVTREDNSNVNDTEKEKETEENETDTLTNNIENTGVIASEDDAGNRFLTEELRIQILPLEDESILPENYIKTTIVLDGLPITVYTWKFDFNTDVLLIYGMNQDGETGLYEYSRSMNTLSPYDGVIGNDQDSQNTVTEAEETTHSSKVVSMLVIIVILGIALIIVSIALVLQLMKKDGKSKRYEKEDDFF